MKFLGITTKEIMLNAVFCFVGIVAGYFISAHFESKERKALIVDAEAQARIEGHSLGYEEAVKEFDRTAPEKLEARFPLIFESMRQDARQAGVLEGIEIGRAQGDSEKYYEGFQEGKSEGLREATKQQQDAQSIETLDLLQRQEAAQEDWLGYEKLVGSLAALAGALEDAAGNSEIESGMISNALSVIDTADTLREANEEQAKSFNSLIESLREAVNSRNLPRIREAARALDQSMNTKRQQYLSGVKLELETFALLKPL